MKTWEKYAPGAERWSEEAYADARTYLARRAELVRVLGVDASPEMARAACSGVVRSRVQTSTTTRRRSRCKRR